MKIALYVFLALLILLPISLAVYLFYVLIKAKRKMNGDSTDK